MKRLTLTIIITLSVLLFTSCSLYDSSRGNNSIQDKGVKITKSAETAAAKHKFSDFSLKDINGKTVKLSDYTGKIVFINFWATWSSYCTEEMAELDKAGKEFAKGKDAVLLTLNTGENMDIVKKFAAGRKLSVTVLLDTQGSVANANNIFRLPSTLVINRDGTLYTVIEGKTDQKTLTGMVNKLK